MRDRRSPVTRGRTETRPEKQRAAVDSNTLEDQCHPRKIFVGGLAHKTTTQHLRDHFGRFGPIVDAVVLRWPDGPSRGFGYVTFSDSSSAAGVLKENHQLSGREVDVKRAVPGTNKLFIGGLPQNTTANELREHFEKFGVVSDAVVMIDPATSRSRGFGFVCFLPGQEGATAVQDTLSQYEHHRMRGKWIEVKSAAPPHKLAGKNSQEPSYEELALAGALPGQERVAPSPSPSQRTDSTTFTESKEPNSRKSSHSSDAPALGSPRKVTLPGNPSELGTSPPPGLAPPAERKVTGGYKPIDVHSQWGPNPWLWNPQNPWAQPWPQQQIFNQGLGQGLSRYANGAPSFDDIAAAPLGVGSEYFRTPSYMDDTGRFLADSLQQNLEQFLKLSSMEPKGTAPRNPSVSTTCSAATPTDIASPTSFS